jgi:hypothetical protein
MNKMVQPIYTLEYSKLEKSLNMYLIISHIIIYI